MLTALDIGKVVSIQVNGTMISVRLYGILSSQRQVQHYAFQTETGSLLLLKPNEYGYPA